MFHLACSLETIPHVTHDQLHATMTKGEKDLGCSLKPYMTHLPSTLATVDDFFVDGLNSVDNIFLIKIIILLKFLKLYRSSEIKVTMFLSQLMKSAIVMYIFIQFPQPNS